MDSVSSISNTASAEFIPGNTDATNAFNRIINNINQISNTTNPTPFSDFVQFSNSNRAKLADSLNNVTKASGVTPLLNELAMRSGNIHAQSPDTIMVKCTLPELQNQLQELITQPDPQNLSDEKTLIQKIARESERVGEQCERAGKKFGDQVEKEMGRLAKRLKFKK